MTSVALIAADITFVFSARLNCFKQGENECFSTQSTRLSIAKHCTFPLFKNEDINTPLKNIFKRCNKRRIEV